MSPSPERRGMKTKEAIASATTFLVFAFFDLLDLLLCFFFRLADTLLDGHAHSCYCGDGGGENEEEEVSDTLYGRKNLFRDQTGIRGFTWSGKEEAAKRPLVRWSDCGCKSCTGWQAKGEKKLHYVVREPSRGREVEDCQKSPPENVIFLHGFLSSSSMWIETVFQNLSGHAAENCRLFAVDLLGFGESPKPSDCLYRVNDHLHMIETSITEPLHLKSFHLVAHSMGCVIALALASKRQDLVKSITLVAPPYFPSPKETAASMALNRLAGRKLWPPLLIGSAIMSWYEHLGRCVCLLVCRNHRTWEFILKLATRRRNLRFMITDLAKHTHHSAWHTMHNVLCGAAKYMDGYLENLGNSEIPISILHGTKDKVVLPKCSYDMKLKIPLSRHQTIDHADHVTVILGRERDFTRNLEETWFSSARRNEHRVR